MNASHSHVTVAKAISCATSSSSLQYIKTRERGRQRGGREDEKLPPVCWTTEVEADKDKGLLFLLFDLCQTKRTHH